jgi:hypothetical protein
LNDYDDSVQVPIPPLPGVGDAFIAHPVDSISVSLSVFIVFVSSIVAPVAAATLDYGQVFRYTH